MPEDEQKVWLNRNVVGMGLASLFSEMSSEMASAVLPIFLSSVLGAPAYALGLIEGVAEGLSTLFELWSGWYSDRIGKRKGLIATFYVVIAASMVGFAAATNWLQLMLLGWSIRLPVRDTLLVESTTPATVNRAFSFMRTLNSPGAIAGPLLATLLLAHVPIRIIFLIAAVPCLCAILAIVLLVREKARTPDPRGFWQSVNGLPPHFNGFLVPVGLFGLANFASTFLILRAQEVLTPGQGPILAATIAAGLYTWSNVAYCLVSYPLGVLADRYSKKTILGAGYLLFGLLCFGFLFANDRLWLLVVLFAASGICTAIVEASEPALASDFIGDVDRGAGYGALSATQGTGAFLSSIIVGFLWSFASPAWGFVYGGVLAVAAAVLLMRVKTDA
jgi:MFS family permease